MNQNPNNSAIPTAADPLYDECRFWLNATRSWMNVIARMIAESGDIKASPEVTADVARTAGDLSLLAERLIPLRKEIEFHCNELLLNGSDVRNKIRHNELYTRILEEGNVFRSLLADIFRLEQAAYRKFLS